MKFLEDNKTAELIELKEELQSLSNEPIITANQSLLSEIKIGCEQIDEYIYLKEKYENKEDINTDLEMLGYGIEDLKGSLIKAGAAIFNFIKKLVEKLLTFVLSFFNKGMTLKEKLFIAAIVRKASDLNSKLDEASGNKNKPLELNERKVGNIVAKPDLFLLYSLKESNTLNPSKITDYVRNTLTLFTDNIILFDNTVDSITNMLKAMKDDTTTQNTFIGYFAEKNKFLIDTLKPLKELFKRNPILDKIVTKGLDKYKTSGYETFILPLPQKGLHENKMEYVVFQIRTKDEIGKLKYEDVKSVEDLIKGTKDFIELKDIGINVEKINDVNIKSASYTEIETIVEIYKESSEKLKKKLNTDKITSKLEKLKKKLTTINTEEFDSKASNYKLHYLNTGIKLSTTLLEMSRELYESGYTDSIKNYILAHTV